MTSGALLSSRVVAASKQLMKTEACRGGDAQVWRCKAGDSCSKFAALRLVANVAGTNRVMLGSDAPFPIGDPKPAAVIIAQDLLWIGTGFERRPAR